MKITKRLIAAVGVCVVVFIAVIGYWTFLPRQGTLDIPGEGIYTGRLKGKTFHGYGTYVSYAVGGVSYEGEWKDGVFHGRGTMTFANGATLSGEFINGSPHGIVTMTFPDGHVHQVEYEGGYPVGEFEHDCDHDH